MPQSTRCGRLSVFENATFVGDCFRPRARWGVFAEKQKSFSFLWDLFCFSKIDNPVANCMQFCFLLVTQGIPWWQNQRRQNKFLCPTRKTWGIIGLARVFGQPCFGTWGKIGRHGASGAIFNWWASPELHPCFFIFFILLLEARPGMGASSSLWRVAVPCYASCRCFELLLRAVASSCCFDARHWLLSPRYLCFFISCCFSSCPFCHVLFWKLFQPIRD